MIEKDDGLSRAIAKMGTSKKLADELKIKPQAVSQWSRIPLNRVFKVSELTGIPSHELRPDFFKEGAT